MTGAFPTTALRAVPTEKDRHFGQLSLSAGLLRCVAAYSPAMTHEHGAVDDQVLVAGAYSVDLVFRDLTEPVAYGTEGWTEGWTEGFGMVPGGAYPLAMGLRRPGREVVRAADFGADPFSHAAGLERWLARLPRWPAGTRTHHD